jgi:hypothetical protein
MIGLPNPEMAGAVQVAQIETQIARSLIGVNGIERVRLREDGSAWGFCDRMARPTMPLSATPRSSESQTFA